MVVEAPDGRRPRGPSPDDRSPVIPERAALTELARGFLLSQRSDPERAARFAATFLKERSSASPDPRALPPEKLAYVRRGIASAFREDSGL